jgi:DNA-directed RNA polymerase sigma subunit (sigma70/sigma32)
MTLADIGDALGISRERVRQEESQAIARVAERVEVSQSERRGADE